MRVVVLAASLAVVCALQCSVQDYDKVDCGFYGINQTACEQKSCCWATSSVSGTPYCFYQAGSATSCYGYHDGLSEPFSQSEVSTMRSFFMANINIGGKGGVVAAPDYNTPGGSYYYHWMRDAALTMRCLQETASSFASVESTVKSYVSWVLHAQADSDPNGIDVRTEPKFMLPDGEVFSGAWCRPQNDGPGLRATTLIIAANSLLAAGEEAYVKANLWTGNANDALHGGAIKYDLDYVVSQYATNTCDLWEEIRDPDLFWNRFTMKKAMILGQAFATKIGDSSSAASYASAMKAINSTLYNHYNGGFIQECSSRTRDSAVIVGLNDGFDESDRMFAPTSLEAAKTVSSYNTMFCNEYSINTADSNNGLPGVLYGRYQGDSYAGGNPWVLSTAALASLFYRGAIDILTTGGVPSSSVLSVWQQAFNYPGSLPTSRAALAKVFASQGDGVLLRLRSHVTSGGFHLDEQIDRNTGVQLSAKDLTWSYAEVLNAMHHRANYLSAANQ